MDIPEEPKSSGVIAGAEKWFADAYHTAKDTVTQHPGETALAAAAAVGTVAAVVLAPEVTLPVLAIGGAGALTGCTAEVTTTPPVEVVPATGDPCLAGPPVNAIIVDSSISDQYSPFNAQPGDQIEVTNGGVVDTSPGSITWVDPTGTAINDGGTICNSAGGLVIDSAKVHVAPGEVTPQSVAPSSSPAPSSSAAPSG